MMRLEPLHAVCEVKTSRESESLVFAQLKEGCGRLREVDDRLLQGVALLSVAGGTLPVVCGKQAEVGASGCLVDGKPVEVDDI